MIPEIDKKKLFSRNELDRRHYVSVYLDRFIRMPLANFDNEANKLTLDYVYKMNDLLEAQKELLAFYDVMVTYLFTLKNDKKKYFIGGIMQTALSIRKQRRHIRCVKDCVKRTKMNSLLGVIIDKYISDTYDRIKYLETNIVPIHINLTPLAALYNSCIDSGDNFSEKMAEFVLPEEINVYKNQDYNKKIDFTAVNKAKEENASRLAQVVSEFNEKLEKENKPLFDKYMQEYNEHIAKKQTKEMARKEARKAEKELKALSKKIAQNQKDENAALCIQGELNSFKTYFDDEIKKIEDLSIETLDTGYTFIDHIKRHIKKNQQFVFLVKQKQLNYPQYVMSVNSYGEIKKTINPVEAGAYTEEEKEKVEEVIKSKKLIEKYDIINLCDYIEHIDQIADKRAKKEALLKQMRLKAFLKQIKDNAINDNHGKSKLDHNIRKNKDCHYVLAYYNDNLNSARICAASQNEIKKGELRGTDLIENIRIYTYEEAEEAIQIAESKGFDTYQIVDAYELFESIDLQKEQI